MMHRSGEDGYRSTQRDGLPGSIEKIVTDTEDLPHYVANTSVVALGVGIM